MVDVFSTVDVGMGGVLVATAGVSDDGGDEDAPAALRNDLPEPLQLLQGCPDARFARAWLLEAEQRRRDLGNVARQDTPVVRQHPEADVDLALGGSQAPEQFGVAPVFPENVPAPEFEARHDEDR